MKTNEKAIIERVTKEQLVQLWQVMCDQLENKDVSASKAALKLFSTLVVGAECIDKEQAMKYDDFLQKVCVMLGYDKRTYQGSSVFENCINLRRIFSADDVFLSHQAVGMTVKNLSFATPSQQAIFSHLDPILVSIKTGIEAVIANNNISEIREKGTKLIEEGFPKR